MQCWHVERFEMVFCAKLRLIKFSGVFPARINFWFDMENAQKISMSM